MRKVLLVRFGEVYLKGLNRSSFLKILVDNVKKAVKDTDATVWLADSRIYVANFDDMDDMINLHVGASYRFDKVLTLWVKGNNLLNRKWDYMPGMGAQGLNFMGGVSLVF